MKGIPTLFITILNLIMLQKLRKVWEQRRKLRASITTLDLKHISYSPSPSPPISSLSGTLSNKNHKTDFDSPSTASTSAESSPNKPKKNESMGTISKLFLQPRLPGQDPPISQDHFNRIRRCLNKLCPTLSLRLFIHI